MPAVDPAFRADVLAGLALDRPAIPCKWLYDDVGAETFEAICGVPSYYPTRTELSILRRCVSDVGDKLGGDVNVIEYGAGSGAKTRHVLADLNATSYVPIDISRYYCELNARELGREHPELEIVPVEADYTKPITLPATKAGGATMAFFPGGTIGNFRPGNAAKFLANVARTLGPGGRLLVGVDLRKDPAVLHAAYNDEGGVTARFNLNLLDRINRELDGDFDTDGGWHHYAPYLPDPARIEMHLVSGREQTVTIAGRRFDFDRGDSIHTEDSHKHTRRSFAAVADSAGFDVEAFYTDDDELFSVQLLRVRG